MHISHIELVPVILFIGVMAAAGIFLMVRALSSTAAYDSDVEVVEGRLRAYRGGEAVTPEEVELQLPFVERVVRPNLARLGSALQNGTPQRVRETIDRQLHFLDHPGGLSTSDVIALRYVAALGLGLLGIALGFFIGGAFVFLWILGLLIIGLVVGLFLPTLWLRQLTNTRRLDIERSLPIALDLLSVSVEAGLSFDVSMQHVAEQMDNALASEFRKVIEETRLGRPRMEALEEMSRRCDVDDIFTFVQAIVQSQQLGTPISLILRQQSEEIRRKRLQRARERGAQATLKMLLPMAGCIFPTIWVILLAPALFIVLASCNAK